MEHLKYRKKKLDSRILCPYTLSFKGKSVTSRLFENNYLLEDELYQEWELMQTEAEVCVKLPLIEKWEQHVKSN